MRYLLTSLLCVLTLSLTAQVDCPNTYDGDDDGAIGISDLLGLLSLFGDADADSDGVWDSLDDCVDETACNYLSNPTEPCIYLDALGVCGGYCIADDDGDGICDPAVFNLCGDLVANLGYDYSTVQIGEQCWFAENCRFLPEVSPSSEGSETEPYYYVYNYNGTDVESAKSTDYYETYGVLYNYSAVMSGGICPSGWHIPSDEEWQTMEMSLGMSEADAASEGWRGTDEGDKLKSTSGWLFYGVDGNGSNSSGFNGLPGGNRDDYDGFFNAEYYGMWWSPSESGDHRWLRNLGYSNYDGVYRVYTNNQKIGLSARCLRD